MLLATKVLVGFLRGLLTNLDTPPAASDIRSILVRPPNCQRQSLVSTLAQTLSLFVVPLSGQAVKKVPPTQIRISEKLSRPTGLDSPHQRSVVASAHPTLRIRFMGTR